MDFPQFDGTSDPVVFINQCELYFRRERIMAEEKVWLVSRNLKADARVWFHQVEQDEYLAWRRFTELQQWRFKPPPCPDPLHQLSHGVDNSLHILEEMSTQLDRIRACLKVKDKRDRERRVAVRLQAAVQGLLVRRRAHLLRAAKVSEEQVAVRLQAVGRGFLVRRVVRKMHMLLSTSLSCVFVPSAPSTHQAAPIAGEV
jgi:hypothetical protein